MFDCKENKDLSHRGTSWTFTGYGDKQSKSSSAHQPRKQSNPRKEMHDKLMSEALLKVEHKQVSSPKLAVLETREFPLLTSTTLPYLLAKRGAKGGHPAQFLNIE